MTEKTNNKQKNKKIVLALVWNLLARRLFGGMLGICDFRYKTPRQSQTSLSAVVAKLLWRSRRLPQGGTGLAQRTRFFRAK